MSSAARIGITRRIAAVFLSVFAVLLIVLALVVRTARNEIFTTDRYVQTVSALAATEQLQTDVADAITDSIVDNAGLDSPEISRALRQVGLDPDEFKDRMRSIIQTSALSFVRSDTFTTLWADTNRAAHQRFVALLESDVSEPLTVDLKDLATSAAESVQDSKGYISKIIPLKNLAQMTGDQSFQLMSADAVDTARTVANVAAILRWALLIAAAVVLAGVWLLLGRGRSSVLVVGLVIAVGGLATILSRQAGTGITVSAASDSAEESVRTIYGIATNPLKGYGITAMVIGAVIAGAAYVVPAMRRAKSDQASGSA